MFRIGEFAQIAQVSGRQLRYYDQLGLLRPVRIEAQTGYRYYSIRQLPRLNSILALKDLGFSLDQVAALLEKDLGPAELRSMLTLKRAEVARTLREEEARLRHIQSRIDAIDGRAEAGEYDVVVKSAPPQPYLSMSGRFDDFDEAFAAVGAVAEAGARQIRPALRDKLVVLARNDAEDDRLDLQIGFTLTRPTNQTVTVAGGQVLTASELPGVTRMATIVRSGPPQDRHQSFGAIGAWMEAHACEVDGACREVFLEPVAAAAGLTGVLVEIQFPLRDAA